MYRTLAMFTKSLMSGWKKTSDYSVNLTPATGADRAAERTPGVPAVMVDSHWGSASRQIEIKRRLAT